MNRFELDLDFLKKSDSAIAKSMYPKIRRARYAKNRICIGENDEGKIISMDFRTSQRITILGQTRSGKTYLTRRMIDVAYKAGVMPVIMGDLKPNFYTSVDPIPRDEAKLMQYEQPAGLPLKIYYPEFFKHFTNTDMSFEYYALNFSLDELNVNDFMSLMGLTLSDKQRMLIETVWGKYDSVDDLLLAINEFPGVTSSTKSSVLQAIQNLVKYNVIGNENHDIVEAINQGFVPILCLAGEDALGENKHFMTTYVGILLRKLYDAARTGRLKKRILMVLDEAPRYITKGVETPLSKQIVEVNDKGAEHGISILFAAQFSISLPEKIFSQSRYIFLGHNIDDKSAIAIFKMFSLIEASVISFGNEVREIKGRMEYNDKDGTRDWMMIDTSKKDYVIFQNYSPLSKHLHERK